MSDHLWHEPFELYTKIDLGCVQNLLISIIKKAGYDECYLGAVWPWEFILHEEKNEDDPWNTYIIKSVKCVTDEILDELYGIRIRHNYCKDFESLYQIVREKISDHKYIVVAADTYFVPYLYKHIYLHKHGAHATMPVWFDDYQREIVLLSATPYYNGRISSRDFRDMLENSNVYWYMDVDLPNRQKEIDVNSVFLRFRDRIEDAYSACCGGNTCSNRHISYADDIMRLLEEINKIPEPAEQMAELKTFLLGDAGRLVDRKGLLLVEYLQIRPVQKQIKKWNNCIDLVLLQNNLWKSAFNLLYLSVERNRVGNSIQKAIDKFKTIIEQDKILIEALLG